MIRTLPFPSFATLVCAALLFSTTAHADVRLPALISDNMVLQQKAKATVWGQANPSEKVTVKIADVTQSVTAGVDGHWAMKLPPMKAGGPYDMTISGRNKIVILNVLVGEVWVCSGQSNMSMRVKDAKDAETEIAAANFPKVRMFTVTKKASGQPESECEGKWEVCDPAAAGHFSAVAYFFGRDLFQSQKVPVGLINSSVGGTSAEEWIPAGGFDLDPALKSIGAGQSSDVTMAKEEYKRRYSEWVNASEQAKAAGQTPPPEPKQPKETKSAPPSQYFNGMISPLLPYSIRGVCWYQGEQNTRNPQLYRKLFPALIQSWRQSWSEGDFPFLFVQLPGFLIKKTFPTNSSWAELREAQAAALKLPKTAMAVTIDIGDEHNLHPADKQDVGHRLALAARANVYGEQITGSGPVYASSKVDGNRIIVTFKQTGGGLAVKNGDFVKGFAIAGEDKKFVWADAEIQGDTVIVTSDDVPKPVAVRYAWADSSYCTLFNKAGLPAAPFRSDDW